LLELAVCELLKGGLSWPETGDAQVVTHTEKIIVNDEVLIPIAVRAATSLTDQIISLESLRSDSRYADLLRRMGLSR
jgi:hypothetical protein